MSYEQKYLKYKSKYLSLKKLNQVGGNNNINKNKNILEMEELTITPSATEMYGYNPKKVSEKKENNYVNIKKLTKLLEDSDVEHLSNLSTELSGGGGDTLTPTTETPKKSEESEEAEDPKTTTQEPPKASEASTSNEPKEKEQDGGAKKYNDKVK